LFNIFKQLPEVRVEDNTCNTNDDNHSTIPEIGDDPHMDSAWGTSTRSVDKPRVLDEESYTDEENRIYYDKKMKKYEERISNSVSIETAINAYDQQDVEKANTSSPSTHSMEESEVQLLIM
jgi:hypothetical protein